ncbi:hypothetical protein CK203_073593 [Vitis vinifera]|uniref:Uncharacterized protein n=1 Tax=Vitis vinifera TaxID=29760 RepID=A0A438DTZ5_VITVI|nr:hypothetical protein CK203_073593 [Vitis vinifera]
MLSMLFDPHIISYEPPKGFLVPKFTMCDGTRDPFDHLLHYWQLMTLDIGNDVLLYKCTFTNDSVRPIDARITLPPIGSNRVILLYGDALVLTLGVSCFDVHKILIDLGNSTNLLQMSAYRQMGQPDHLKCSILSSRGLITIQCYYGTDDEGHMTNVSSLLMTKERSNIEALLHQNVDIFAWSHSDMPGKMTSKVAIQRQIKSMRNHEEEDHLKEKSFSRSKLLKSLCKGAWSQKSKRVNWNHNPIVKRLEAWLKLQDSGTLTRLGG